MSSTDLKEENSFPHIELFEPENLLSLGENLYAIESATKAMGYNKYPQDVRTEIARVACESAQPLLNEYDAEIDATQRQIADLQMKVNQAETRKQKITQALSAIKSAAQTRYYPGLPGPFDSNGDFS